MHEPSAWSSAWQCDLHGEVYPLRMLHSPSAEGLEGMVEPLELRDLRDPGQDLDLPFGAPSPRLAGLGSCGR